MTREQVETASELARLGMLSVSSLYALAGLPEPEPEPEPERFKGPQMIEEPALLAAVCEWPQEDTPRLVYADWCDERAGDLPSEYGAAYAARAELIRTQIEIHRGDPCPLCNKRGRFVGTHGRWCELTGTAISDTDLAPEQTVDNECVCRYYGLQRRVEFLLKTKYVIEPISRRVLVNQDKKTKMDGNTLFAGAVPFALVNAREWRYLRGFVGVISIREAHYHNAAAGITKLAPVQRIYLANRMLAPGRKPVGKVGFFWDSMVAHDPPNGAPPDMVIDRGLWALLWRFRDKDEPETPEDCYTWLSRACVYNARAKAGQPVGEPQDRFPAPMSSAETPFWWLPTGAQPVRIPWAEFEQGRTTQDGTRIIDAFLAGDPDLTRCPLFYSERMLRLIREVYNTPEGSPIANGTQYGPAAGAIHTEQEGGG